MRLRLLLFSMRVIQTPLFYSVTGSKQCIEVARSFRDSQVFNVDRKYST